MRPIISEIGAKNRGGVVLDLAPGSRGLGTEGVKEKPHFNELDVFPFFLLKYGRTKPNNEFSNFSLNPLSARTSVKMDVFQLSETLV